MPPMRKTAGFDESSCNANDPCGDQDIEKEVYRVEKEN